MATKHEQILAHIRALDVGEKISVRKISKMLNVSEGTAYRAIKDAELQGFVSTIGRVGTIRIEKQEKENIEKLTFAEVVNIVEGTVIGGRAGLHKTLSKFVIGAMKLEAMMRYVEPGSLLIIGNRTKAHQLALEHGAPVLITGGFDTTDEAKALADEKALPIISCSYDTFTVGTMINRAIDDRLLKKEITLVEDIQIPYEQTYHMYANEKVEDYMKLSEQTDHSRFPVVDEQQKVKGVVTSKDIMGALPSVQIQKCMTQSPITTTLKTSVASVAHDMVWEGIEMLPVVNQDGVLEGIITRQDVLKALQMIQKQPQIGETFQDLIMMNLEEVREERGKHFYLKGTITPQMTDHMGMISSGVLTTMITNGGKKALSKQQKGDLINENITVYFLKPVQIENEIEIHPHVIELSRKFGKVDVEVWHEQQLVAKALLTVQFIDRH